MKRFGYIILLSMAVLFFVLFSILSKYEDRDALRQLDFAVTVKVQERIDRSSHLRMASLTGNLMEGATFFASPEFTVILTLIMTGIAVYDRRKKRWNMWALVIPLALVLIVGAEVYGKSIVHHPSPPFSMIKHPTTIFPADYINDQFSYPSGHSARAVYLAIVLFFLLVVRTHMDRKKLSIVGVALLFYVGVVAISRVYLGHHWFSDVMGGILLGCSCALLSVSMFMKPRE